MKQSLRVTFVSGIGMLDDPLSEDQRTQRALMWSDTRETVLAQMSALEDALALARRGEAGARSLANAADAQLASLQANEAVARSELRAARAEIVRLTEEVSELRSVLDDAERRTHVAPLSPATAGTSGTRGAYERHAAIAQHRALHTVLRAIQQADAELGALTRALAAGARTRASAQAECAPMIHALLAALASAAAAVAQPGGACGSGAERGEVAAAKLREAEAVALRLHLALGSVGGGGGACSASGEIGGGGNNGPRGGSGGGGGGALANCGRGCGDVVTTGASSPDDSTAAAARAVSAALGRAQAEAGARLAALEAEVRAVASATSGCGCAPGAGTAPSALGGPGGEPVLQDGERLSAGHAARRYLAQLAEEEHLANANSRLDAARTHADSAVREVEAERARAARSEADAARARAEAEQLRRRADADAAAAGRAVREARAVRDEAEGRAARLAEANAALQAELARASEALRARSAALDEARAARSEAGAAAAALRAQAVAATGALDAALDARAAAEHYRQEAERAAARERSRAAQLRAARARTDDGAGAGGRVGCGASGASGGGGGSEYVSRSALVDFAAVPPASPPQHPDPAAVDPALRVGGGYTTVGDFIRTLSPRPGGSGAQHARLDSDDGQPEELAERLRALSPPGARTPGGAGAVVRGGRGSRLHVVPVMPSAPVPAVDEPGTKPALAAAGRALAAAHNGRTSSRRSELAPSWSAPLRQGGRGSGRDGVHGGLVVSTAVGLVGNGSAPRRGRASTGKASSSSGGVPGVLAHSPTHHHHLATVLHSPCSPWVD